MSRGIVGTAKLAVTLAFAIPIAVFGVDYLLRGRLLIGGVAVAAAVLMVVLEEYLTTPGDVPGMVAGRVVDAVAKEPEPEDELEEEPDD